MKTKTPTTTTHTPGPWQVSPLDGRTCGPSRLLICNGTTLAQMQAVAIVTLRTSETDANARLIAAAPDLLAALREMVDMVLSPAYVDKADEARAMEARSAIVTNARRVIAKVEGR